MLAASIFLPCSHWADREEMEWQQGRGSEESGSEGDREKKHVEWEWGDRQEEQKERTEREGVEIGWTMTKELWALTWPDAS